MRTFLLRPTFLAPLAILLLSTLTLPWLLGQDTPPPAPPFFARATDPPAPTTKARDVASLSQSQRHLFLSAQRGADWLQRANKPDGRFVPGLLTAQRTPMDEDSYLRQVGAAFALARAAAFLKEEHAAAIARQALLSLLLDTAADPSDDQVRFTAAPASLLNRTASAGMLVLAIHELPAPRKDLLEQAQHLCNYLRKQVREDGTLAMIDPGEENRTGENELIEHYSGVALHGIIRSHASSPAPWKIDCLRRAVPTYQAMWQQKKSVVMAVGHTAAFAEAYVQTREKPFAEAVFAMNDWLCTLQYRNADPRRPQWSGGFMPWVDGKAMQQAPDIRSAAAAESLADACRAAQLAGDVSRHKRYKEALESCLQFITGLQYTESNTQHFAEWYRPLLVGGFYASPQDGNLRLDYTQHALSALVQYLHHVAELP